MRATIMLLLSILLGVALTAGSCGPVPATELDCVANSAGQPVSCVPDDDDSHSLRRSTVTRPAPTPVPAGAGVVTTPPTADRDFQRPATTTKTTTKKTTTTTKPPTKR
jgi:hypothetical protein